MTAVPRCLVADDHPALTSAVSQYLAADGFEVAGTAPDGLRALSLAAEEQPDVAVLDYRMPRLAGVELIAALRAAAPATRICVYTADADEALVRDALEAGAAALVLKSSPLGDLARALQIVLAGGSFVDRAVGTQAPQGQLTRRELDVLELLAEGLRNEEIGTRLGISQETVRTHLRKATERLGAATRTQAVATAVRMGLIA